MDLSSVEITSVSIATVAASILALFVALPARPQGVVETGYTFSRNLCDRNGVKQGRSDMFMLDMRHSFPLTTRKGADGSARVWALGVSCRFAAADCSGRAAEITPASVLNAALNVSHRRNLGARWYMTASLGAGIYSQPRDVSWASVLVNGAVVFAYRISDNFDIGIGAGLTNTYGAPLIMPMAFVRWRTSGRYTVDVHMAGGAKVSVTRIFTDKMRLELVPFDLDGFSCVTTDSSKHKIYGSTRMRCYLRPEIAVGRHARIYLNAGMEIYNSVRISDRSLKGFFGGFGGRKNKYCYAPAPFVAIGVGYGF